MSLIRDPDYVKGVSLQIVGVQNVQEEACRLIASEAEYMLRKVIQKFYGHEENENFQYKKLNDFWYVKRNEMDIEQLTKKEILSIRAPPKITISMYWLSINGIVPKIPENTYVKTNENIKKLKEEEQVVVDKRQENIRQILIKENAEGILSKELNMFFVTIVETVHKEEESMHNTKVYTESPEFKKVRECLQNNPGLNNIVPFLINMIYKEHTVALYDGYIKKKIYVHLIMALANNRSINLEYHAHLIIKILLTFVVSPNLSINAVNKNIVKELKFRDYSAKSLATFIYRYTDKYPNLQYEVASVLIDLLIRPKEESGNLNSFFGILRCFYYLSTNLIKEVLLPQLPTFINNCGIFKDYSTSLLKQEKSVGLAAGSDHAVHKIKEVPIQKTSEIYQLRYHYINQIQNAIADIMTKILGNLRVFSLQSSNEAANIYRFFSESFGEVSILHILRSFKLNSMPNLTDEYDMTLKILNAEYFI